jgi:drug/metabolite transporter (DMT)-like permease
MACGNLFFGRRPSRLEILSMSIGTVGVVLLVRGSGFSASAAGLAAISIATISWSAGSLLGAAKYKTTPGAMGLATQMICGGTLLLILSAATHESPQWPPTTEATLAWVYLVTFGSLIAFSAYMTLLLSTPTPIAMSYTFVNPVIAMGLGAVLAGERLTPSDWLATAIIIGSVALLLRRNADSNRSEEAAGKTRKRPIDSPQA